MTTCTQTTTLRSAPHYQRGHDMPLDVAAEYFFRLVYKYNIRKDLRFDAFCDYVKSKGVRIV